MKCPYDRWTGSFKSYGKHMAAKHRRIMLKNLAKARKAPHHRGSRKESVKTFAEHHTAEIGAAVSSYPQFFCPRCGHALYAGKHVCGCNPCGGK